MATVSVRTQQLTRDQLAVVFKDFQTLKSFENMQQDVSTTIPEAIDGNTEAVEIAQATADAALVQANNAQITANTALANAATAQSTVDALKLRNVPLALVDAATITSDAIAHNSFYVTLGGNRTLGAPANLADGMLLNYIVKQDGTGNRTLAFNAIFDFGAAGTPTMSTLAGAVDYIYGYYDAIAGKILAVIRKAQSTASYFSAHNNSVNQSIPSGALTALNFSTTVYNVGSNFAASAWTPPAGKPVNISGACALTLTGSGLMILSIFKNGAEFKRGPQANFSGYVAQDQVMNVTAMDVPNGTDVYTLRVAQTTGSAMNTDGLPIIVWFQGSTIQP